MDGKLTLTASETFVKRNTNRSIDETFAQMPDWIDSYRKAGIEADSLGRHGRVRLQLRGLHPGGEGDRPDRAHDGDHGGARLHAAQPLAGGHDGLGHARAR